MRLAIHGQDKPHPYIASSLNNLGGLYWRLGKLGETLEKHEKCLEMRLATHGHDKPHHDIAVSLGNIGVVHHNQKTLNQVSEFLEQSLWMLRVMFGENSQHQLIKMVQIYLADVYEYQDGVAAMRKPKERSTETEQTGDGGASSLSIYPATLRVRTQHGTYLYVQ